MGERSSYPAPLFHLFFSQSSATKFLRFPLIGVFISGYMKKGDCMQGSIISADFNLFTVLFLLMIFLGINMQISKLSKKVDELIKKQK